MPEVEASSGEQGVAAVASATFQPVAVEQAVVFGVTDDGFDDRALGSWDDSLKFALPIISWINQPGEKHTSTRASSSREPIPPVLA